MSELGDKKAPGVVVIVPEPQTMRKLVEDGVFHILLSLTTLKASCGVEVGGINKRQLIHIPRIHGRSFFIQQWPLG